MKVTVDIKIEKGTLVRWYLSRTDDFQKDSNVFQISEVEVDLEGRILYKTNNPHDNGKSWSYKELLSLYVPIIKL